MDLILINGRVYTQDPENPLAEAVAVRAGRIAAVGRSDEIAGLRGDRTLVIDLAGKMVLPGFIDAHVHFLGFAFGLSRVDLGGCPTLAAALERLREFGRNRAGSWIIGYGWDDNSWERRPTRWELDRLFPQTPVVLARKDWHAIWVNSQALEALGIRDQDSDPPGSRLERDERGRLTGIIREDLAMKIYAERLPQPPEEEALSLLEEAIAIARRHGITSIHTMEDGQAFHLFRRLDEAGRLGLRVWAAVAKSDLEAALRLGLGTGFGNERLRFGHLKLFLDGTLGSQTADMLEPFEGQPGNRGIVFTPYEEADALIDRAARAGIAVALHAIGDAAVRKALDLFALEKERRPDLRLRHRIEHAQLVHPDDLPRFGKLGLITSMQPIHCTSDIDIAEKYWGARSRYAYPFRSLKNAGARLAFGSDCPVESLDPLAGIRAAATRAREDGYPRGGWYPQEKLSVAEAVDAYTSGAAWASYEEKVKGKIAAGYYADLVVLSRDIFALPPEEVCKARVEMTIFDGRLVYSAE